ncbi:ARL14 effector protein-like [Neodiprion pinetum]|uniref:ARL14 effector protein-like n=1 Tax=Neodiprion pinetum TaxID=441929 RepID=UPI001EDCBEAC|nr:ARL14 effector protein-like [Neodiprion pinetum]XP_046617493.1 ARL14 effector protein-like [Neodiprion virginianus]
MSDDLRALASRERNSSQTTKNEQKAARLSKMAAISSEKGFKPFLSDFDPETSEREKRKMNQRLNLKDKKHVLYDDKGIFVRTGEDLCDCLQRGCPGCHFPCSKCRSRKCAHECRVNRKWAYKSISYEGSDIVIRNQYLNDGNADH